MTSHPPCPNHLLSFFLLVHCLSYVLLTQLHPKRWAWGGEGGYGEEREGDVWDWGNQCGLQHDLT